MTSTGGYLQQRRDRRNRVSVQLTELCARSLITFGGIGTIIAVSGVLLFLLWVVKDLFLGARIGEAEKVVAIAGDGERVLSIGTDEYRVLGWLLQANGSVRILSLRDGAALGELPLAADLPAITAVSSFHRPSRPDRLTAVSEFAIGFADGTVRVCSVRFDTSYYEANEVPRELRTMKLGDSSAWRGGVVEFTPSAQFRVQQIGVSVSEPARFGTMSVVTVHLAESSEGDLVVAATADGAIAARVAGTRTNLLTGEASLQWRRAHPLENPKGAVPPDFLAITDFGGNAVAAWRDGQLTRYSVRRLDDIAVAEQIDVVAGADDELTALSVLLGESTLLAGDSTGKVSGWFVRNDPSNQVDGTGLVVGHRFQLDPPAAVRRFAASERQRLFIAATEDAALHALFMTSGKVLGVVRSTSGLPVDCVAIAPKDDGLLASDATGLTQWDFEPGHPEITAGALFGKVWYERYDEPAYAWQSSSGTDDFEQKFSLVPLIFGTVKATVYSMLFGVPIALLAAVYTSQFLSKRARARVKPAIEMMASLPSVVLGFLAALVLAPMVERLVPTVLCAFATIPVAVLLGAYLWRLLPGDVALRLDRLKLLAQTAMIVVGGWAAAAAAPAVERLLFAGDTRLWLDGQVGSGLPALLVVLLPLSAVAVALGQSRVVNPWLRNLTAAWSPASVATAHLVKFLAGVTAVVLVALGFAAVVHYLPTAFGMAPLDLRAGVQIGAFDLSPIGTFDQRNALVVGFIMGFAVIPIIYTLAEDALSSVPDHLRAASLGAGATPWQTAMRIVIPTAMSGLFSSVMIGLGRAVGETMIVLMAAGNTPVLSMNTFSGFRTLSANIATELPETAANSTHFRTLYLAALVLFAMTFLINTMAESVRQRFRKRAYQL